MMALFIGTMVWAVYFDTLKPNPGFTAQPGGQTYDDPQRHRARRKTAGNDSSGGRTAGGSTSWQSRG